MTKIGILIDFKINQDFIAEVLCINRDKPITTCHGNCFLADKLKKAEENNQKEIPKTLKFVSEILFFSKTKVILHIATLDQKSKLILSNENLPTSSHLRQIFRPPKASILI